MTYADASSSFVPSAKVLPSAKVVPSAKLSSSAETCGPSLMRRLYNAIIESRRLSAERELRWHAAFVEPSVLAKAGLMHLAARDAAHRLPFGA